MRELLILFCPPLNHSELLRVSCLLRRSARNGSLRNGEPTIDRQSCGEISDPDSGYCRPRSQEQFEQRIRFFYPFVFRFLTTLCIFLVFLSNNIYFYILLFFPLGRNLHPLPHHKRFPVPLEFLSQNPVGRKNVLFPFTILKSLHKIIYGHKIKTSFYTQVGL